VLQFWTFFRAKYCNAIIRGTYSNQSTLCLEPTLYLARKILGFPSKASWGAMQLDALPMLPGKSGFLSRLEKFIHRPSIVANFLLQKLPSVRLGLHPFDFSFPGGSTPLLWGIVRLKGVGTKILDAHSSDYDWNFLEMNYNNERTFYLSFYCMWSCYE